MKAPLYLSYAAGYPDTFENFVEFAYEQGFSGVELIPDLSPNLPEEIGEGRIETLRELKSRYNLQYTVHNIFLDINPTSLVPKVRQLALDLTREVLRLAKDIEAQAVIAHTGYRFSVWRTKPEQAEMFEEMQRDIYIQLAQEASEIGIPIFLENGHYYLSTRNGTKQPLHIGIDADELIFVAKLPAQTPFGICFDVGKAYASVEEGSIENVLDYLKQVTPLLREIHVNTFSRYDEVVPSVLAYLEEINFDGPIVFECARKDIDRLKRLFVNDFPAVRDV